MAFSARYWSPKPRSAPQENPPRKTGRQKLLKANLWQHIAPKQGSPKTPPDTKLAETKRFPQFSALRPVGPPKKKRKKKGPKTTLLPLLTVKWGSTQVARQTFEQLSGRQETPIFATFWSLRFASGSLSALRRLLISNAFVFSGPLAAHPGYIYIYIYIHGAAHRFYKHFWHFILYFPVFRFYGPPSFT